MSKQWITDRLEMEAILNEAVVGSFATVCPDGSPYVVTVNHVYHQGKIYFHCALTGKKLDNIKHEPRVCFEAHIIDRLVIAKRADDSGVRYHSVIINGRAKIVTDPKAKLDALTILSAKYTMGHDTAPPSDKCTGFTGVVEIEIDEMTGKKNVD